MRNGRRTEASTGPGGISPLEVYIDELALYGFPASARFYIAEAVEQELSRLLAEQGPPPEWTQGGAINLMDAGKFDVGLEVKPDTIGRQVARAVYGSRER